MKQVAIILGLLAAVGAVNADNSTKYAEEVCKIDLQNVSAKVEADIYSDKNFKACKAAYLEVFTEGEIKADLDFKKSKNGQGRIAKNGLYMQSLKKHLLGETGMSEEEMSKIAAQIRADMAAEMKTKE